MALAWQKIIIHRLYDDGAASVAAAAGARVNYGPLDCTRGVYYHISGRRRQRHQPSAVPELQPCSAVAARTRRGARGGGHPSNLEIVELQIAGHEIS